MPPRSPVRTNIVIFTVLGFVVALLVHFVVLSTERYNWFDNSDSAASSVMLVFNSLIALL
ncbi:light-harvesting protein [Candidatus Viridilinea mediisalina]|uniref:Light-harvesting protein n=1 Tax=Candidatus Viridilinea mediisalina TaxID=2024553 RepID=A0A2A6RM29_9CHLR|nr:light-harvesting protein [Candidatus Viridilinea mediisalina]PDW03985.1 light-harvesting protein [Candidatus Viridilinea mediisalina]